MSETTPKPKVIILRKRGGGHHDDEHGGQWKIAYADFVTAMMAFFLIMWLLSSTTAEQRESIAKFFQTTTIIDMITGNGVLDGGKSVMESPEGSRDPEKPDDATEPEQDPLSLIRDQIERQRIEAMKAELERMTKPLGDLSDLAQNILVEVTSEGLRIQVFDRDGEPMFAPGASEPSPRLARILQVIGSVIATVPNEVVVTGHTDSQAFSRGNYGNWELSSDRANSSRRALERAGVPSQRMYRVEGRAATEPLLADATTDPRNRRIAITVLRTDVVAAARAAAATRNPFEARR